MDLWYYYFMSRRTKIWLVFAGIIIFASFLRLYHITTIPPGLYPDEAMDGNNALEVIQTGHFKVFYTEDNGREGLYVNTLVFFIKAFGNKPWVVRFPAAIAGILTVAGMYFLGEELFGTEVGLLAAFLLGACFWHINFSRIGFRAIMAPLALIWTLYFLIKSFRSLKELHAWIYAVVGGIVFAAGFYTYIAYRVAPLLLLLFIPFFKKYPHFWKRTAVFVVVAFIVALPIGLYFLHNPGDFFGRTAEISVTNAKNPLEEFALNVGKTLAMFNFKGDGNWRQNIAGAPELYFPVGILFLIGIVLAGISLWRSIKKKNEGNGMPHAQYPAFSVLAIFVWFILAIIPAAASDEGIPHALRSILTLPPAIFLAAIAGVWAFHTLYGNGFKKTAVTFTLLFLIIVGVNAYTSYFITWAENPNVPGAFNQDYVDIGNQINALPTSTPKYVVVVAGGVLARGIPVPAETVMFVTDSFTTSTQIANHITYLLPYHTSTIPARTPINTIFYVD
jgi:4-amino-4-deoxy-L-arabinose transferase-like glycosyltransferase